MGFFEWIWDKIYALLIENGNYKMLLRAFGNTMLLALFAVLIGIVIGVVVAIGKVASAHSKKLFLVRWLCNLYITVIRGTPGLCPTADFLFCAVADAVKG